MSEQWLTYWTKAQRGMGLTQMYKSKHQEVTVHLPPSSSICLRFSSFYDEQPFSICDVRVKEDDKATKAGFHGQPSYELHPNSTILTDPIDVSSTCHQVTITYTLLSSHAIDSGVSLYPYDPIKAQHDVVYAFHGIDIKTSNYQGCIVLFGDSITEQGMWSQPFSEWAKAQGYLVLNLGISGNRLCHALHQVCLPYAYAKQLQINGDIRNETDEVTIHRIALGKQCFGKAGKDRFEDDVLRTIEGLQLVIFALGVNDLFQPGTFCADLSELPSKDEAIKEVIRLHTLAQKHQISWLNVSLTPLLGSDQYSEEKETIRKEWNQALQDQKDCLGIVNLDAVLCEDGTAWNSLFHKGDHVHPNVTGGKCIADCIIKELKETWNHG